MMSILYPEMQRRLISCSMSILMVLHITQCPVLTRMCSPSNIYFFSSFPKLKFLVLTLLFLLPQHQFNRITG
uniref:Uncharacterized protein n=1 Tax=Arundo donax TaxID=35708 RepID=A0A0A9D909_ARUDO